MGLFDDIACDFQGIRFDGAQTKDLECFMHRYRIEPDGRLFICQPGFELVPEAEQKVDFFGVKYKTRHQPALDIWVAVTGIDQDVYCGAGEDEWRFTFRDGRVSEVARFEDGKWVRVGRGSANSVHV